MWTENQETIQYVKLYEHRSFAHVLFYENHLIVKCFLSQQVRLMSELQLTNEYRGKLFLFTDYR